MKFKLNDLLSDGMSFSEAIEFIEYNEGEPFELGVNTIYNKSAFDMLPHIDDESIDLVILDPDYQQRDDFCKMGIILEAVRVLKPSGNILCFTKQPFDHNLRCEVNDIFRREIVWTFTNGGAWVSKKMPLVSHQKIFHCVKNKKECYFNERTGVEYSEKTKDFKRSSKVFGDYKVEGRKFKKDDEGVWLRDHLHFNKPHTGKIPSKPQGLYDILIRCYCPDGGMVLEPFSGSCNFARSCIKQGKRYIGTEMDETVYKFSMKNINDEPNLFSS